MIKEQVSGGIIADKEEQTQGDKVPLYQKLSYSLTDFGGNLLFVTISTYLLYFYTDVFGLSVGVAGTLLLITRFIDAIDAPIWGALIDRTNTRWGQSRPYFLWLCVPFALFSWLTFSTPDLSGTWKVVYAVVTYIFAGVFYTGISSPMTSILPNLSNNPKERVVLNSYRMVGGNIGLLIANSIVLPLVAILGQGNDQRGFSLTLAILGIIAIISFLIAFANVREVNSSTVKSIPLKKSVKAAKQNWPWIIIVITNLIYWIGTTVRSSGLIYYFQYNIDAKNLVPIAGAFSSIAIIGMILIPFMVKLTNKRYVLIGALLVSAISNVMIFFVGMNTTAVIIFYAIGSVGTGVAAAMPFVMLSDAVDFGHWKNGIRASGLLTTIGSAFCVKAGSGIGAFLPSQVMSAFNYRPNSMQTPQALFGIELSFVWMPAVLFVLAAIPMFFYGKYEKGEEHIRIELLEREV
ncbi:MFS transporter [Bacillus cabrialesii]|uniref:MFS transporter n=1 Tax=Bacillus cabrialesii TaxID=2487276 RepID=UPI001010E429|nr:MFS transporter [Bacillus cabrialesii]UQE80805.1 MFS transporter [Bacillus cabrialesii]